ncbi:MAG: PEGA domain-containing protein [gamma proteobacterium endosymbiont of Lamellibrachia anaximandri]|nr:PEGA domain-containing protein [gamma proteobacterium endosymbiont of Lamellibrachia anaximandri]MBL3617560.1 PEGA domain-containing protein [gamma proteobacterium endosymbiont of Lamellibrachia anaximandri]
MFKKYSILFSALLLQGCGSSLIISNTDTIPVRSEPSGAAVYVMGKSMGNTPVDVKQQDVFPVVYDPEKIELYGIIQLEMDGCEPLSQRVSGRVISRGVDARLKCGESKGAVSAAAAAPVATPVEKEVPPEAVKAPQPQAAQVVEQVVPKTSKERLIRLNDLYEEGLVSEKEYQTIRNRILNEL